MAASSSSIERSGSARDADGMALATALMAVPEGLQVDELVFYPVYKPLPNNDFL
jgi:hypothetical protein